MSKMIKGWISALILFGLMGIIALGAVIYSKGWLRKKPPPPQQFTQEQLDERQKRVQADAERIRKEQEKRYEDIKSGKIKVEEVDEVKREHEVSKRKMELLREMGLVMDLGRRTVYVEPAVWYGMTLPEKHSVSQFFSKFFVEERLMEKGIKKMPESLRTLFLYEKFKITASVSIRDGYSGIRLGKANSYGFFLD